VHPDGVPQPPAEPVDRLLEPLVLERGDLAAALADHVVMVFPAWMGGLVAGGGRDLDPADQLQLRKELERPVNAGDPDLAAAAPQVVEDLLRRQAAGVPVEGFEDRKARPPGAMAGGEKLSARVGEPWAAFRSRHRFDDSEEMRVITIPITC
jgi:hypothetical protein